MRKSKMNVKWASDLHDLYFAVIVKKKKCIEPFQWVAEDAGRRDWIPGECVHTGKKHKEDEEDTGVEQQKPRVAVDWIPRW